MKVGCDTVGVGLPTGEAINGEQPSVGVAMGRNVAFIVNTTAANPGEVLPSKGASAREPQLRSSGGRLPSSGKTASDRLLRPRNRRTRSPKKHGRLDWG